MCVSVHARVCVRTLKCTQGWCVCKGRVCARVVCLSVEYVCKLVCVCKDGECVCAHARAHKGGVYVW